MIVSLYYYLRVVKAMFVDSNDAPIEKLNASFSAKLGLIICMVGVVLVGFVSCIYDYINSLTI
jgi:NADH-quinone oxidoreductase subunit N